MDQIKKIVQVLLEKQPALRDNDNELMVAIWKEQTTSADFFVNFQMGRLTSPETIRRNRAKLQQEHQHLRGNTYEIRQKLQKKVQQELGYQFQAL